MVTSIESYIKIRENSNTAEEIQKKYRLSEATLYVFEIGYQCFKQKISLDVVLKELEEK
jgi:hypothetical protein